MAFTQQQFFNGDVDYIAKLNANAASTAAAINQLLVNTGTSTVSSPASPGLYLDAVFSRTTTLIGVGSYQPTPSGSNLNVAAGSAYRSGSSSVVSLSAITVMGFVGQPSGTYYVTLDSVGVPTRATATSVNAIYSVDWSGSSFGIITRLVRIAFNAAEEDSSRVSTTNSVTYATLDARMEAIEGLIGSKIPLTYLSTDPVLGTPSSDTKIATQKATKTYVDAQIASLYSLAVTEFGNVKGPATAVVNNHLAVFDGTTGKLIKDGGSIPAVVSSGSYHDLTNKPSRKVGITIDGGGSAPLTGTKGAIQVDFAGSIVGWSIISDATSGGITVHVEKKASSVPPAAPGIPNTTTDRISSTSAPIALSVAQSASAIASNLSTWVTTTVSKWDVLQFTVTAAGGLTKASLYLLIQEPDTVV